MALDTSLVSYWKFDESSGNAADSVGSNTGTNTNTVTYSAGKINNGAVLNGVNQCFALGSTGFPGAKTARTISMWVKPDTLPTTDDTDVLFNYGEAENYKAFGLSLVKPSGTHKVRVFFYASDRDYTYTTSTTLWTHFAVTYDGTTSYLYINGVSVDSFTPSASVNTTVGNAYIGRFVNAAQYFPDTMIDEVGIWSRALTSDEITKLYNSGNGKQYPFSIQVLISETLALVESITNLRALQSTISETLSLSEIWTALKGILFTISEIITTSETYTSLRTLITTISDSTGLSEVVSFFKKWTNQSESSSTFTNPSKNTSNFDNQTKN